MGGEDQKGSPGRAIVRLGDDTVTLTSDDASSLKDALIDFLRRSDSYARERLLSWAEGPAQIDAAGLLRIGPWLLDSDRGGLFLRCRENAGPETGKAHRAEVRRDGDGWQVTALRVERIRLRR